MRKFMAVAATLALAASAGAAVVAYDEAGSTGDYSDGLQGGDNGGYGFGGWTLARTGSDGTSYISNEDRVFAGDFKSPFPGLPSSGNYYFSMWHNGDGGETTATRPFASPLAGGSTFSMSFDHGWVDDGRRLGVRILNGSNVALEFSYLGGNTYHVDGATGQVPVHGWTPQGMDLAFTQTSDTTFSLAVHFLDNDSTETFTGSLGAAGAATGFQVFTGNQWGGWERDIYFNKYSVATAVPEPAGLAAAGLALGALGMRKRRQA